LVVVPFAGSGTECISAMQHGRSYWGAEIKPEYVKLARDRIAAALNEPSLPLESA
jgi:DNA modification methylase